jgi:uncharacterized protein
MNNSAKINQVVELIRLELTDLIAIYLYGSQADGSANENSDYDFAVYCPQKINWQKLDEIATKLELIVDKKVDLVSFSEVSNVLQNQILSKGKRIFCTDEIFCNNYETNKLSEYFDFKIMVKPLEDKIISSYKL